MATPLDRDLFLVELAGAYDPFVFFRIPRSDSAGAVFFTPPDAVPGKTANDGRKLFFIRIQMQPSFSSILTGFREYLVFKSQLLFVGFSHVEPSRNPAPCEQIGTISY